jgi:succinate dehydrogenase flavin-adding protein (antitoxin of CptAB toxin-antitoxin module)|tara:strand:+ start:1998 stop:2432 length:435 start_codon:yes stop_codon:yes gene_type:complete
MDKQKTEIIRLLKHKKETCARLLQKIGEQVEAVNNQDHSRLAVIIEGKEGLIAGLNETDQKISDLARDLDEATRESLTREFEELGRRIDTDLKKIIEQETVCQEKLNIVKNEVLEKIKDVKNGKVLLKGYGISPRIKPKISKNV